MPDHDSNGFILLPNKSIPCAFSPRLCAHAALCLKHGFEERLGKPLSNALKTYLVTALTTGLTSSNLEGLPLLVDSFTKWYLEICTAYPGSDFTYRESQKSQFNTICGSFVQVCGLTKRESANTSNGISNFLPALIAQCTSQFDRKCSTLDNL